MPADVDRYRRAATDALKLLDWCIFYFRQEGHSAIATRLEENRAYIRRKLTGQPEETLQAMSEGLRGGSPALNPVRRALDVIGLRPMGGRPKRGSQ
jgi:hypothetical protein